MSNKTWYIIWGCLYILCALLGFIPEPAGFAKAALVLLSAAFFVPGAVLLYRAAKARDVLTLRLIRTVSLFSLAATLLLLVANFLSAGASQVTGELLYGFLVILTAPMVCSQYWAASMFLWACLLMASLSQLKKAKKQEKA